MRRTFIVFREKQFIMLKHHLCQMHDFFPDPRSAFDKHLDKLEVLGEVLLDAAELLREIVVELSEVFCELINPGLKVPKLRCEGIAVYRRNRR